MKILVIDIGGTNVKVFAHGLNVPVKIESGRRMTPRKMANAVLKIMADTNYSGISIGYPGPVKNGKPFQEPHNLANGWVGFDFERAFGKRVKMINDAAMQALGSYEGGRMLFLGLGTGLGSTLIVEGVIAPLELAHLPYKQGHTFEYFVGVPALNRMGLKKWQQTVLEVIAILKSALQADCVVLGGGNAKQLIPLPEQIRLCKHWEAAYIGGCRLWQSPSRIVAPRQALLSRRVEAA
jgi:polyphosphate glucokinase